MITKSEFARKIKEKYPQYKSVDDIELVNRILVKYPQYAEVISKTPVSPIASIPQETKEQRIAKYGEIRAPSTFREKHPNWYSVLTLGLPETIERIKYGTQEKRSQAKQELAVGYVIPLLTGGLENMALRGATTTEKILGKLASLFKRKPSKKVLMQAIDDLVPTEAQKSTSELLRKASATQRVPLQSKPITEEQSIQKVIDALKKAKILRGKQEKLFKIERAKRFAKAKKFRGSGLGEKGYHLQLKELKGELPKLEFEAIRNKVSQQDIDNLMNAIDKNPWLSLTDTFTAKRGLKNMFNGKVPTKSEIELLNKVFPKDFIREMIKKRPLFDKYKNLFEEIINIPRSMMSSMDLSFGGRQGIFAAPRFRKEFWRAWKSQFKEFGSEKAFQEAMENITKHKYFNLARESGVDFTNIGSVIGQREERFASSIAEKIPWVRASGRAYTGFANKFRMDIFGSMVDDLKRANIPITENLTKNIADFVNAATGRGKLPKAIAPSANLLNAVFFSPKFTSSRLQLLFNPKFYLTADKGMRLQAWKTLSGFAGFLGTTLTLAKLSGLKVGTNPYSADFGKIKTGNTRIDITGGLGQYIRLFAQLIGKKIVSSTTGKVYKLGEGYKSPTQLSVLMKSIEYKQSPIASFATTMLRGKPLFETELNVPKEVMKRFIPMAIQDFWDLYVDDPRLLPLGTLGIFGLGLQTYKKKTEQEKQREATIRRLKKMLKSSENKLRREELEQRIKRLKKMKIWGK